MTFEVNTWLQQAKSLIQPLSAFKAKVDHSTSYHLYEEWYYIAQRREHTFQHESAVHVPSPFVGIVQSIARQYELQLSLGLTELISSMSAHPGHLMVFMGILKAAYPGEQSFYVQHYLDWIKNGVLTHKALGILWDAQLRQEAAHIIRCDIEQYCLAR